MNLELIKKIYGDKFPILFTEHQISPNNLRKIECRMFHHSDFEHMLHLQFKFIIDSLISDIFNAHNYKSLDKITISDKYPIGDILEFRILNMSNDFNVCVVPTKFISHIAMFKNFKMYDNIDFDREKLTLIGKLMNMDVYTVNVNQDAIFFTYDFFCNLSDIQMIAGMSSTISNNIYYSENFSECAVINLELNNLKWDRKMKLNNIK